MNKFYRLLLIAGAALPMVGCDFSSSGEDRIVEYYPVCVEDNEDWGFIGPDGKIYLADEYKNQPTAVVDGHFVVEEGNSYTLYKFDTKKPKAVKNLDELDQVTFFSEGLIGYVKDMERISFADKSGKTKFTLNPISGKEIIACDAAFSDGLLLVMNEEHELGYVNTSGNMAIKLKYSNADRFSEGLAYVVTGEGDDARKSVINTDGEEVLKIKSGYEPVSMRFKYGVIIVRNDDKLGFLDKKGEFSKVPSKVKYILDYNEKMYIYFNDEYDKGVMSRDGEEVIRAKYDYLEFLDNGKFLAKKNDKFMLLDSKGEKVDSELDDYDVIDVLNTGIGFKLLSKDGHDFFLTDYKGKKINKQEFSKFQSDYTKYNSLESKYFDVNAYVRAVTTAVSSDAIGHYTLGVNPSKYLPSPDGRSYTTLYSTDDVLDEGYKYKLTVDYLRFDSYIAFSDYNSWTYDWYYYFNPDCKLCSVRMKTYTTENIWSAVKNQLVKGFEKEGFRLESEGSSDIIMKSSDNNTLTISPSGNYIYYTIENETELAE